MRQKQFSYPDRPVLEKIAFVMEIGRLDSITKDELYTILDGISGNMAQMGLV